MDQAPKETKKLTGSQRLSNILDENRRRKEQRALVEEMKKRISIAREGRAAFEKRELTIAMNHYRRFLALTARGMGVELADLNPKLFPEKDRVQESLLVSAICLDLAKILDQLGTESARAEKTQSLRLFTTFTIGMPFQAFVAEGLRKYIVHSPYIRNKAEFQSYQRAIQINKGCFIATAVFESAQAPEVLRLQHFRDKTLAQSKLGRGFIGFYYFISPSIAERLYRHPRTRSMAKKVLEKIAGSI